MLKDATIMIRMIVLPQSPKRRRKSLANLPTMRCIRREIASILRHTSTLRLPYCDGGFGSRKRKTHYQVEAQDVCKVFFKNMYDLTNNMLKNPVADSLKPLDQTSEAGAKIKTKTKHLQWAEETAELLPMGDAAGLGAAERHCESSGKVVFKRLHECDIKSLHALYATKCEAKFKVVGYQKFIRILKRDSRLKHIYLAREKSSFGECTEC
mmetsp:Transcript_16129/g.19073  ORF Transcript_16129/g.19073 Transcript_16129/m.19073 type:complete len:210 (-) Transcript_16129:1335-1964(-)